MTPTPPPGGTVAFLFTDIEGSTRLWERFPVAMSAALERHDALLRHAIESNNGYVFKTIGDAFCAAFHSADDALRAAIEAQVGLADGEWNGELGLRVRMAIHQGDCDNRANDYFGQPLNRVARMLGGGHGGQVLLSEAARAGLNELREAITLEDLGLHQFRDLRDPMEVWQVVHPDLPHQFPPLRSETPKRTNLPAPTTAFIGRERERNDLRRLFAVRLLTITGLGGIGKTRLTLEIGAQRLEEFRHGVWFVELEPVSDPELISQVVAEAVGVREIPGGDVTQELLDALRERQLLLILDNVEHLLKPVSELVDQLLRFCPRIQIMVTSREALGVHGEMVYPLRPMPEPDAMSLFIDRAQLAHPNFAAAPHAPVIARICQRLDGLPLAIEMAAARVRVLTVEQIEKRLENRFDLLTDGGNQPQQRSLRELIDWNYDLLDESERRLLSRLGVFSGGWTLEAVEQVCADNTIPRSQILDLLTALVDKSLVLVEERPDGVRYRMLESLRQYVRERLRESGEMNYFREKHAHYFLDFVEEIYCDPERRTDKDAFDAIERDLDDIRIAQEHFATDPDGGVAGLRLATALVLFWEDRGYLREGQTRLATALAHPGAQDPTPERAHSLDGAGKLALRQGDDAAAEKLYREALTIFRQHHDAEGTASGLDNLATVFLRQGNADRAYGFYKEALTIWRRRGNLSRSSEDMTRLGQILLAEDDVERAVSQLEEAHRFAVQAGNTQAQMLAADGLGIAGCVRHDAIFARKWFALSLPLCRDLDDKRCLTNALLGLAYAARMDSHVSLAVRFSGAQKALRDKADLQIAPALEREYDRHVQILRAELGNELFDAIYRAGEAMRSGEAWAEATHYAISPDEAAEGTIQVL
ncbi:MAG: hypothetical protein OHK0029_36280 [Armatimonadaceae bacterium]